MIRTSLVSFIPEVNPAYAKLRNPFSIYENAKFGPNLENGDIIKRVNGMPLGETEKMLEIWSAIKVAQKIQVDLERKGEIHTYTFLVRN